MKHKNTSPESSRLMDWHLIADALVGDVDHYIGYYSAMQVHGLITQPSLTEQIVVSRQICPSKFKVESIQFQFICHNSEHFFGFEKMQIDNVSKASCSDLEKTFIDCLFRPDYAGGIVEIAKALFQSKGQLKWQLLLSYLVRFNSQAVIKRLGSLIELLGIHTNVVHDLQKIKTRSFVLLDTKLSNAGKFVS